MLTVYAARHVCGLASAAVIERWGLLRKQDVRTEVFTFQQMEKLDCKNRRVMLCDVPFSIVQSLNADVVYCSSHQKEDSNLIEKLRLRNIIVDIKPDYSCTSLLAARLLSSDGVAKLLVSASDSTLNDVHNELAEKVEDVLHAGFDPHELVSLWCRGVLWPAHLEKFWMDSQVRKKHALEFLRTNIDVRKFISTHVGFVKIPAVLSSCEAAKEVLAAHSAVNVAVVIAYDGHVTFRSRNDVDVLQIAKQFGGGGQTYAAGAKIFDMSTADVIDRLYEKLRLMFLSGFPKSP
ncbi:MAG: hypothetical protein HY363_04225 [Candidatus Aenigmarchaeota archaeon]|nr:hypothetical protein [Candidatus Aenigmarchaeota archaeon]